MGQKLDKKLEEVLGAYNERAPEKADYPYKVFSAKRISEDDGIEVYELEVNVWDKHPYYSRASSIMDTLEELHQRSILTEDFLLRIFKGKREKIDDPDKSIKRVMETFECHVYERK